MAKTSRSRGTRLEFDPWSGNEIPRAATKTQRSQTNKTNRNKYLKNKAKSNFVGRRTGRRFSLALAPKSDPWEVFLQSPGVLRSPDETQCLKLSSQSGLLFPGMLQGPPCLLPGAGSLSSKKSALLQHMSPLSLSRSSRYFRFKLLPRWLQVPHTFRSQGFIPPTSSTKGQLRGHWRSSVFCGKDCFPTLNSL